MEKISDFINRFILSAENMDDNGKLAEFIESHFDDNTDRLLFQKSKQADIDMGLAVSTILGHRKLRDKVPSWYRNPHLIFPSSLSVEQCSSEFTAESRVRTILELMPDDCKADTSRLKIADLTGGLGVDCYVFSRHFGKVLYNEMNPVLADAVRHNFSVLGCSNISVSCSRIECSADGSDTEDLCGTASATPEGLLRGRAPDIIYLDPARRAADGKKVFRIEDCQPDIIQLKDSLLRTARFVAVKLSPMADIDIVARSLGPHCRRIDVVSYANECKEVVAYLDREYDGECIICAKCSGKGEFFFTRTEENDADAILLPGASLDRIMSESGALLLEPDKALLKAGAFRLLCRRFPLAMLDRSTHCYIAPVSIHTYTSEYGISSIKDSDYAADKYELQNFFRIFRIIRVLPLDRNGILTAGKDFPQADVTARNIPVSSDELRRRLKVQSSGRYHIFGLRVTVTPESESLPATSGNYLFITERI